jgi:hypothetical protein
VIRDARIAYYTNHGIGWVARPAHDNGPDGFKRAGRFKKASNMNYALALSLSLEKHLAALQAQCSGYGALRSSMSTSGDRGGGCEDDGGDVELEEKALLMAVEETYEASGRKWRPWAANGKAVRIGEIILLVDSDTIVPEVRVLLRVSCEFWT